MIVCTVIVRFRHVEKLEDALKVHEPSCQWLILRYSAAGVAFIPVPWLRFNTSHNCRCKWKQSPTYYQWLQSKSCQRCEEKIIILCLLFFSQLLFLNWCGCAVMVTQDAGGQVCSRNHQIYRNNLIPFRDYIWLIHKCATASALACNTWVSLNSGRRDSWPTSL